jgi:mycofactocin system transcriptional regulator
VSSPQPVISVATTRGRPRSTTREHVAQVALDLFATQGFEETTVEDIAAALGVSRRTLFRYFSSKNDIVWGDFDRVLVRLRDCLAASPSDTALMDALGAAVVESNRYPPAALPDLRIRMTLITRVPALQAHSMLRYREWMDVVALWAARRLGLRSCDLLPQALAHAALGSSTAAFVTWVDAPDSDLELHLTEAYRLLASGFAPA